MSKTFDEIEELDKKINMLAEYLGLEFEYKWGELERVKKHE